MLGYPDKKNGERDNWDNYQKDISKDLEKIINLKKWETIVSHNPDGEYGDIHHKKLNQIINAIVKDKDKLIYFGHYHSKRNISNYYDYLIPIDNQTLNKKKQIIGIYKSENYIQTTFNHMFEYENWISANEWSEELEKIK